MLSRALAESQRAATAARLEESNKREKTHEKEAAAASAAIAAAAAEFASKADNEDLASSTTSPDAADVRQQLSVAQATISHLRAQLARSRDSRFASSNAWKSSEDVNRLLEEQSEKYG